MHICICQIEYDICNDINQNHISYSKWCTNKNKFYQQNKTQYSAFVLMVFDFYFSRSQCQIRNMIHNILAGVIANPNGENLTDL